MEEQKTRKRRGHYMVKTRNFLVRKIDSSGKLMESRSDDDLRLPISLLTYEEFIQGQKIISECSKKKEQMLKENPSIKFPRTARCKGNPYHDAFVYFTEIRKKKIEEGIASPNVCIICGEDMNRTKDSAYPYCTDCARTMMNYGELRGRNNTSGYLHWNQLCVVCHRRQAHLYMKGMCRACYRLGERHNTRDPEKIRELRREQTKKQIYKGLAIPSGKSQSKPIFWGEAEWK